MVLPGKLGGRVGRRRDSSRSAAPEAALRRFRSRPPSGVRVPAGSGKMRPVEDNQPSPGRRRPGGHGRAQPTRRPAPPGRRSGGGQRRDPPTAAGTSGRSAGTAERPHRVGWAAHATARVPAAAPPATPAGGGTARRPRGWRSRGSARCCPGRRWTSCGRRPGPMRSRTPPGRWRTRWWRWRRRGTRRRRCGRLGRPSGRRRGRPACGGAGDRAVPGRGLPRRPDGAGRGPAHLRPGDLDAMLADIERDLAGRSGRSPSSSAAAGRGWNRTRRPSCCWWPPRPTATSASPPPGWP